MAILHRANVPVITSTTIKQLAYQLANFALSAPVLRALDYIQGIGFKVLDSGCWAS